jgi:hypothetical protein
MARLEDEVAELKGAVAELAQAVQCLSVRQDSSGDVTIDLDAQDHANEAMRVVG